VARSRNLSPFWFVCLFTRKPGLGYFANYSQAGGWTTGYPLITSGSSRGVPSKVNLKAPALKCAGPTRYPPPSSAEAANQVAPNASVSHALRVKIPIYLTQLPSLTTKVFGGRVVTAGWTDSAWSKVLAADLQCAAKGVVSPSGTLKLVKGPIFQVELLVSLS
jgi:hypothetical protein